MARKYSNEEKAAAITVLTANQNNYTKSAAQLNIPKTTLRQWAAGKGVSGVTPEMQSDSNIDMADKMESLANMLADSIPEKIKEAKLQNVAVSMGICLDKAQLLRGKATSIVESRSSRDRLETSIKQVIEECAKEGVEITKIEAATLLKDHMPSDGPTLDKIIQEELQPKT